MKKVYQTQQRKLLLAFLGEHKEEQFTIEEIIENMGGEEAPAPSSTYRLMKKLVEEGLVKRYAKDGSRQFFYQLVNGKNCSSHLHLKCLLCGRLIHLSEQLSDETLIAVLKEAGFEVDEEKTILFGKCPACRER